MLEKGPCPACKKNEWQAETLMMGVEKAVFVCKGCGGIYLCSPDQLPFWESLANRLQAPVAQSNDFKMDPRFYRIAEKPK